MRSICMYYVLLEIIVLTNGISQKSTDPGGTPQSTLALKSSETVEILPRNRNFFPDSSSNEDGHQNSDYLTGEEFNSDNLEGTLPSRYQTRPPPPNPYEEIYPNNDRPYQQQVNYDPTGSENTPKQGYYNYDQNYPQNYQQTSQSGGNYAQNYDYYPNNNYGYNEQYQNVRPGVGNNPYGGGYPSNPNYPPSPYDQNYYAQYYGYQDNPGQQNSVVGFGNRLLRWILGNDANQIPFQRPGYGNNHLPLPPLREALNSLARYDDLKCIPKLLCDMVGEMAPLRTGGSDDSQSFLSFLKPSYVESLLNIISIFPIQSPFLLFGKAALQGASNPHSCLRTYSTCPNDPEKLVYYLNNHRGGFFRFFNGGGQFANIGAQELEQAGAFLGGNLNDYQQPQQSGGGGNNLGALASLAQLAGGGGNLGNLAQLLGGGGGGNLGQLLGGYAGGNAQSGNYAQTAGIGGGLSNLAQLLGGGGNSNVNQGYLAQLASAAERGTLQNFANILQKINTENVKRVDDTSTPKREGKKLKKILDKDSYLEKLKKFGFYKLKQNEGKSSNFSDTESRILHAHSGISASVVPGPYTIRDGKAIQGWKFPINEENSGIYQNLNDDQEIYTIDLFSNNNPAVIFPQQVNENNPIAYAENSRKPKSLFFPPETNIYNIPEVFDSTNSYDIPKPLAYYDRTKMIFPDRTGTGNLRFDNDEIKSSNGGFVYKRHNDDNNLLGFSKQEYNVPSYNVYQNNPGVYNDGSNIRTGKSIAFP